MWEDPFYLSKYKTAWKIFWKKNYPSSPTRIVRIPPKKRTPARNKFPSTNFSAFTGSYLLDVASDEQSHGRIPTRNSEGRKGEGRKEGYSYTATVLLYRSMSYDLFRCSRRDCHCVCITLSCYRDLWPGGMYPSRLPCPWLSLYVRQRTWTYICACLCATEWAGVCLRVHYVDCWSRPLRRTQRTSKRFGGLKRAGAKTVGERARGGRKRKSTLPLSAK